MSAYLSYRNAVEEIQELIVDNMLKKIAFKKFEKDKGHKVTQVLPGKNEEYEFKFNNFEGYIVTKERCMYNLTHNGNPITVNDLCAKPDKLELLAKDLSESWVETFTEGVDLANLNYSAEKPPITEEELINQSKEIQKDFRIICADPTLNDLVHSIHSKNHLVSARFLGVDEPQHLMTPGGGHELSNLFTNGDINICYLDRDIAILKPEYNHEMRARVMNQQRRWEFVTLSGEQPEEAVVVGYDDTPVGLFAHVIDGTRIEPGQDISREYIHDVMGFDRNFNAVQEETLRMNRGERIRIQGDLAIEYHGSTDVSSDNVCYIPLDNHLISLENAVIPEDESLEQEPIRVHVPEKNYLNIAHDEHENIIVEIESGEYEFYLLPRGLQIESERPDWPEP